MGDFFCVSSTCTSLALAGDVILSVPPQSCAWPGTAVSLHGRTLVTDLLPVGLKSGQMGQKTRCSFLRP